MQDGQILQRYLSKGTLVKTQEGVQETAAELHDEALFKQPPPRDECPICLKTMPLENMRDLLHTSYNECCGTALCDGCWYGFAREDSERQLCPFCRLPASSSNEESMERLRKRVEVNDAGAIRQLGGYYYQGVMGLPQDLNRAMELYLKAGKLGNAMSYFNVGNFYCNGEGAEMDMKKAVHYWELAAMAGYVVARHNLGMFEYNSRNMNRAVKHWMISAGAGYDDSLQEIQEGYTGGYVAKDDFEKALRAHKEASDEMKCGQREAAAAFLAARDAAGGQT